MNGRVSPGRNMSQSMELHNIAPDAPTECEYRSWEIFCVDCLFYRIVLWTITRYLYLASRAKLHFFPTTTANFRCSSVWRFGGRFCDRQVSQQRLSRASKPQRSEIHAQHKHQEKKLCKERLNETNTWCRGYKCRGFHRWSWRWSGKPERAYTTHVGKKAIQVSL